MQSTNSGNILGFITRFCSLHRSDLPGISRDTPSRLVMFSLLATRTSSLPIFKFTNDTTMGASVEASNHHITSSEDASESSAARPRRRRRIQREEADDLDVPDYDMPWANSSSRLDPQISIYPPQSIPADEPTSRRPSSLQPLRRETSTSGDPHRSEFRAARRRNWLMGRDGDESQSRSPLVANDPTTPFMSGSALSTDSRQSSQRLPMNNQRSLADDPSSGTDDSLAELLGLNTATPPSESQQPMSHRLLSRARSLGSDFGVHPSPRRNPESATDEEHPRRLGEMDFGTIPTNHFPFSTSFNFSNTAPLPPRPHDLPPFPYLTYRIPPWQNPPHTSQANPILSRSMPEGSSSAIGGGSFPAFRFMSPPLNTGRPRELASSTNAVSEPANTTLDWQWPPEEFWGGENPQPTNH